MPLRLHGVKAEKLTETVNAASSESGPLHGFTAQVFTNPLSWTVPGTDTCSDGNPHVRCATLWLQRRSICPMQEGLSSDWIRLRFSVDGCNASYIARRVRGDSPSMDAVGTTYMRRGTSEDEHDIRRLWTALWTRNKDCQELRHSLCQSGWPSHGKCHRRDPQLERPPIYTTCQPPVPRAQSTASDRPGHCHGCIGAFIHVNG
jgi:hypothetical protein